MRCFRCKREIDLPDGSIPCCPACLAVEDVETLKEVNRQLVKERRTSFEKQMRMRLANTWIAVKQRCPKCRAAPGDYCGYNQHNYGGGTSWVCSTGVHVERGAAAGFEPKEIISLNDGWNPHGGRWCVPSWAPQPRYETFQEWLCRCLGLKKGSHDKKAPQEIWAFENARKELESNGL